MAGRPTGAPIPNGSSVLAGLPPQAFLPRELQQSPCVPCQGQWVDLQRGPLPGQVFQQGETLNPPGTWSLQPTGTGERDQDPTNEEPAKAQTDGIRGSAPTFVPSEVRQFSMTVPDYRILGASAEVRPTPPNFSRVPPIEEVPLQKTGDLATPPTTIQGEHCPIDV